MIYRLLKALLSRDLLMLILYRFYRGKKQPQILLPRIVYPCVIVCCISSQGQDKKNTAIFMASVWDTECWISIEFKETFSYGMRNAAFCEYMCGTCASVGSCLTLWLKIEAIHSTRTHEWVRQSGPTPDVYDWSSVGREKDEWASS